VREDNVSPPGRGRGGAEGRALRVQAKESAGIVLLPGDGIGPEVTGEAARVLEAVAAEGGWRLQARPAPIGGAAVDATGEPLPAETLRLCLESDAVLLGAVGGPRWDGLPGPQRPESGLLALRKGLGAYANLRPVRLLPCLAASSPLKDSVVAEGVDLLIVRELTGGLYFGQPKERRGDGAVDTLAYTAGEVRRLARVGFEAARLRRRRVTSVDKANVLETSRLWRAVVEEVARDYPDVELEHVLVDNCAMQLVQRPGRFDVLITENTFGDILSDLGAVLSGSIGLLPSASLGDPGRPGIYEPIHGTAPDIAGQGLANPCGAILSSALLLRYSLGRDAEATRLERAVEQVLEAGFRTADLASTGGTRVGTKEMGDRIIEAYVRLGQRV
jgi:3-isopropylmalate dehydrogenase